MRLEFFNKPCKIELIESRGHAASTGLIFEHIQQGGGGRWTGFFQRLMSYPKVPAGQDSFRTGLVVTLQEV